MPGCCVPLCKNRSGGTGSRKYSFHRFPACQKKRQLWLKLIRREDFTPTANTRVCSWHFEDGFEAGPTRFHWNVRETTYADPMPLPSHYKKKKFRVDADDEGLETPSSADQSQSTEETGNSATQCQCNTKTCNSAVHSESNTQTLNSATQSQSNAQALSSAIQSQGNAMTLKIVALSQRKTKTLKSVTHSQSNTETLSNVTQSQRNTGTCNSTAHFQSNGWIQNSATKSQSNAETLNKDVDPVNPEKHFMDHQKELNKTGRNSSVKEKGQEKEQQHNTDGGRAGHTQVHIVSHLGQYVQTQKMVVPQGETLVFLPLSEENFTMKVKTAKEQNARLKDDIERLKEKLSSQMKRKIDDL